MQPVSHRFIQNGDRKFLQQARSKCFPQFSNLILRKTGSSHIFLCISVFAKRSGWIEGKLEPTGDCAIIPKTYVDFSPIKQAGTGARGWNYAFSGTWWIRRSPRSNDFVFLTCGIHGWIPLVTCCSAGSLFDSDDPVGRTRKQCWVDTEWVLYEKRSAEITLAGHPSISWAQPAIITSAITPLQGFWIRNRQPRLCRTDRIKLSIYLFYAGISHYLF